LLIPSDPQSGVNICQSGIVKTDTPVKTVSGFTITVLRVADTTPAWSNLENKRALFAIDISFDEIKCLSTSQHFCESSGNTFRVGFLGGKKIIRPKRLVDYLLTILADSVLICGGGLGIASFHLPQ
jgi:hypothetical protein